MRDGDIEAARRLDDELAPAYELIGVVTGPIQMKAALNLLGHDVGGLRLPLVEANAAEIAEIRSCLERLNLLAALRGLGGGQIRVGPHSAARCARLGPRGLRHPQERDPAGDEQ